MAYGFKHEYFAYVIEIGFHDPWTSAWMTGTKRLAADSENDMIKTVQRYDAYYKDTYGASAYCHNLGKVSQNT